MVDKPEVTEVTVGQLKQNMMPSMQSKFAKSGCLLTPLTHIFGPRWWISWKVTVVDKLEVDSWTA